MVNYSEAVPWSNKSLNTIESQLMMSCPGRPYLVSVKVFLNSKHIKTTHPTAKFAEKFLGPFEIISQPGSHSFMLKLLSDLHAIHSVFHVSQLKPVEENTIPNRTQPALPPVEADGKEQYEIAQILASKIDCQFWCPLLCRIQWLGYEGTNKEFAWLPATEFSADDFIEDFHCCYPDKPGRLAKVTIWNRSLSDLIITVPWGPTVHTCHTSWNC